MGRRTAERYRRPDGLGARGDDERIDPVTGGELGDLLRELGEVAERQTVLCAPGKVLVAEVIDGVDRVAGPVGRLRHVPRGKPGNQNPALHCSTVFFPTFVGSIRIFASGYSRLSSLPSKRWSRKRARLAISEWGCVVTETL